MLSLKLVTSIQKSGKSVTTSAMMSTSQMCHFLLCRISSILRSDIRRSYCMIISKTDFAWVDHKAVKPRAVNIFYSPFTDQPPSTMRLAPVMYFESSEAKNRATWARSSG